jgi:hypothetical protein
MDSRRVKGTTHYVFEDKAEFEEYFLGEDGAVPQLVEDWRQARQWDWTVADDGGVVQVLKWGALPHPHDRKNYKSRNGYVRTIVGAFISDLIQPQILSILKEDVNGITYRIQRLCSVPDLQRENLFNRVTKIVSDLTMIGGAVHYFCLREKES